MYDWLFFALIATASLATTAILDKFILNSYTKDATAYLIALIVVQQLFAFLVLITLGFEFVYPSSVIAALAGAFQIVMWVSYLKALAVEEVSRVTPLVFIYPLFVFAASALLLGETLSPGNYVGGLLLVISAFLVSYKPGKIKNLAFSPAVKYMFFFWVFVALYAVTAKYLLAFMDEWHLYFWTSIGNLVFGIPLLRNRVVWTETKSLFRKGRALGAVLLEEVFDFLGRIGFLFAYALGSVALAASVNALQPLMVLIYVIFLSLFMPWILKEEMKRETVAFKFAAVILVAIGIYLIA